MRTRHSIRSTRSPRVALLLLAATSALLASSAHALPSFSRQTGAACADCHVGAFGPQLTPFGINFKLTGYTLTKGESNIPVSAMLQSSFQSLKTPLSDGSQKATLLAQQASVFLAGGLTEHLGAFVQATGTAAAGNANTDKLGMDEADIRYARTLALGEHSAIVGVSLNNNPTVSDALATVPAWRFPYIGPTLPPGGATPMIDGGLGQQTLGLNVYTLVDSAWYAELGGYKALPRSFLEKTHVIANGDPYTKADGISPYWRLAYMGDLGGGNFTAGVFGLNAHILSDPASSATDKYRDLGLDASYQRQFGDKHTLALNAAYLDEKQNLDASFANGAANNASNSLHRFDLSASYYYDQTYGLTAGLFRIAGSADGGLYAANPDTGYAGTPDTNGYVLQADWTPFGKSDSWGAPWANLRMGLQYTGYTKFNGASSNYDGSGRNACDNNTLYAFVWSAF